MTDGKIGIIDSLSAGFETVTRAVWVILIPVLLDLYLWLGPRLSISPLLNRLSLLITPPPGLPSEYEQAFAQVKQSFEDMGEGFNLFSLLATRVLGLPSLMASGRSSSPLLGPSSVITVGSGLTFLGLSLALALLGVIIACLFLGLIAHQVLEDQWTVGRFVAEVAGYCGKILLFGLLLLGLILFFGLPLSFFIGLVTFVNQTVSSLLLIIFWMLGMLISFYLVFVVEAIVISRAGTFQAIWNSVNVVHRNLWSTLGLILVTNLLIVGLGLIWRKLSVNPWGTVAGIAGNAYVGSGLVATSFIFYGNRYAAWQESRKPAGNEGSTAIQ